MPFLITKNKNSVTLTNSVSLARKTSAIKSSLPFSIPAMPSIFTLELTTLCNNRCSGCANVELTEQRLLRNRHNKTMHNWREIIDTIVTQTNRRVIFRLSGGEPTLHPEFAEIVRYIDALNIPHALLTTGKWQRIGRQTLVDLYKNCRNAVGILISLHGTDAATHNAFVESGERGFEETMSNIQLASEQGITVFTNTVLTKDNCSQIEDITQLSKKLGAHYTVFNRFIGDGHPLQPTENQLFDAIRNVQILRGYGVKCRIGNSVPACFFPLGNFPSAAGYELCSVSPEGNIRPDNLTAHSFGNLLAKPLSQIWQSTTADAYRNYFPDSCLQCAALSSCRGGAKSPYFRTEKRGDSLMKQPLSMEQSQRIDDDKEKKQIAFLALTSD
jgi:radical SAM protein with 4Fe4S-binding SPASM domain